MNFPLCLPVLLLALVSGGSAEAAMRLDLKMAERLVLERNLDLRASGFDARSADGVVRRETGLYDPRLALSFTEGESRDPLNLQFFRSNSASENRSFSSSLTQKFSTGADLSLSFTDNRQRTTTLPKPEINPAYSNELKLSLVQPLLKGFGSTVTEQQILFAVKDRNVAVQDLREKAFELVAQVRNEYFDVLRYRDNLEYRHSSVALARKVLEDNRSRERAGLLPPVEVLEAEVGLTQRDQELLDARRLYEDALDRLALLLSLDEELEAGDATLRPLEVEFGEEDGYRAALVKRPDLQRRMRQLEKLDLERTINRNGLLPSVDLEASYSHKGLGEDLNDGFDGIASEDLRNWQAGINLSYPLGNREARYELARTGQRLKSEHARLRQLREEVRKEVRAAIRRLEVNERKIEVANRGRDLAQEKLRILLKRKEVGLATTRDVLEGEEDLARTRTDQIAAIADYNSAVTGYLRASGLLLEEAGISFNALPDIDGEEPLFSITPK